MKIIFLDIDGVFNSGRTSVALGTPHGFSTSDRLYYDWVAVSLVRKLCTLTHTQCVLSSSWRLTHSYSEMAKFFDLPIIGATPKSSGILKTASGFELLMAQKRGDEIESWLTENIRQDIQLERYIIIDDNDEMLLKQKPYFVHVSHSNGFSLENYDKALKLLRT